MRLDAGGMVAAHRVSRFLDFAALAAPVVHAFVPVAAGRRPLPIAEASMSLERWTPERVEQLRGFVVTGLSCSQIATEIGVTRNAVIGKIHRLGLSPGRPGGSARTCPPRASRPRAAGQRGALRLLFADGAPVADTFAAPTAVDSTKPCSLIELEHGTCRWPITEAAGAGANFVFCGNGAAAGLSYCAGHARLAYRGPGRRRA
jgi:GcrA cell cycle regulator